jgi:hypothetical protein
MPRFARPLNTSEVSGRDSLRGLYKDSITYDNLLRFQVKVVITPPNEADALPRTISETPRSKQPELNMYLNTRKIVPGENTLHKWCHSHT